MKYIPDIHHRKSIRLKEYDYSQAGYYFLTICTHNREHLFGNVVDGKIILNEFGRIVEKKWFDLTNHNNNVELDYYCIMPNHIHCIIILKDSIPACSLVGAGSEPAPTIHGLSEIVRQLKTFSSKLINDIRNSPGLPVWQRNYYEHIIRNDKELYELRKYIENNPTNWKDDEYY